MSVQVGSHLAAFYSSDETRGAISVSFLAIVGGYRGALAVESGAELKSALDSGSLTTARWPGPDLNEALASLERDFPSALARGPALLRVVREVDEVGTPFGSVDAAVAHEHARGAMAKRFPSFFLCQYDCRKFDGVSVVNTLKAHPDAFGLPLSAT